MTSTIFVVAADGRHLFCSYIIGKSRI